MHIMDYGDLLNLSVASHRFVQVLGTSKERFSTVSAGQ